MPRLAVLVLLPLLIVNTAYSQRAPRSVPSQNYFAAVEALYRGRYRDAEQTFRRELRGAIKTSQSTWIDSICYHAMLGETLFLQGRNAEALEQFDRACNLYVSFSQWLLNVQFPQIRDDNNSARRVAPWGSTARNNVVYGRFPETMLISQGKLLTESDLQQGGALTPAQSWAINALEIVRATALAIYRRNELLGPLASQDALSRNIANRLSRGVAPPNHWSSALVDVQLGIAKAGVDDLESARVGLSRGTLVSGRLEHPLTCVALLEQGRLAMAAENYQAAANFFAEAGFSAFYYENYGVIDEALTLGQQVHLITGQQGVYPPLTAAGNWAKRNGLDHIYVRMRMLEAECLAAQNQPQAAEAVLSSDAARQLGRRDLKTSRLAGHYHYLAAWVGYQLDRPQVADQSLAAALNYAHQSGLWNFQISLLGGMLDARTVTARAARTLYPILLRDPVSTDWAAQPLETLGVLTSDHQNAYERWFAATWEGQQVDVAFEVAERAKRHRFLSALPLGGRMLGLRMILEAPPAILPGPVNLQRQSILGRHPQYAQYSQQALTLGGEAAALPLAPEDAEAKRQFSNTLTRWATANAAQERILMDISLSRQASALLTPPVIDTPSIQQRLPRQHVLVSFYAMGGRVYAFALTNQNYDAWDLGPAAKLRGRVAAALREMGNHDGNRELPADKLADNTWQESALRLRKEIFEGSQLNLRQTEELIVVPDDVLWYVPFEALPSGDTEDSPPLLVNARVRYSPLASLAVTGGPIDSPVTRVGVYVGKLTPRASGDDELEAAGRFVDAIAGAQRLPSPLLGPAKYYGHLVEGLVVFADYDNLNHPPLAWEPLPDGRRGSRASLADWLGLPFGTPGWLILPGYHTAAESGLKSRSKQRPGDELFYPLAALMSCGTRTVLISRWRTGGATGFELVQEFAAELGRSSPTEAWQRAAVLAMDAMLDPEREPRIAAAGEATADLTAEHPFLWSGYLLADVGVGDPAAQTAPPPERKPAVNFRPAQPTPPQEPPALPGDGPQDGRQP